MAEQPKKYEPIQAIEIVIKEATGIKPTCGEGHDLFEFLQTKATATTKGARVFVSYHGFAGGEIYASGRQSDSDTENYTIYIHTDKSVREIVNKIRAFLRKDSNMIFVDTCGDRRIIAITGGSAMREQNFGVFEMNIRIL